MPTDAEWTTLTTNLGGASVAGGKLKEAGFTHWQSPNEGASNSSGFTALPNGYRNANGPYNLIGGNAYWWSSTENSTTDAYGRYMYYNNSEVYILDSYKPDGFSVRCLRD